MRRIALVLLVMSMLMALMPAAGAVPGSGTVIFVNTLTEARDLYADDVLVATDPGSRAAAEPAVTVAGTGIEFAVYVAGETPAADTPVNTLTADLESGEILIVVVHEDDSGSTLLSTHSAYPVTLELSETYTQVIHAADAPELEVTELNHGFLTPAEGFVLESGQSAGTQFSVPGTNRLEFVDPTGPTTVHGPEEVEIIEGANNVVILAGFPTDYSLISVAVAGLWETTVYSGELSGDAEVPPVDTPVTGRVAMVDLGTELWYTITLNPGDDAEVTAAHIHAGAPGENGPVLATLFDGSTDAHTGGGRLVQGLVSDGDLAANAGVGFDGNYSTLIRMLKAGELYVNVHSDANPPGEVRADMEPLTIPMEPDAFSDISGSVHAANINVIAEAGIALGRTDGTFGVNDEVTRGQLATFIGRALGLEEVTGSTFSDTAGSVHEGYINAAAEHGIVNGRTDGTFGPNDPVTRGQAAAMLARALAIVDATVPGPAPFTDISGTTFEAEITVMYWIEAVNGCTADTYCPDDNLTRGQMASILSRALGWELLLALV